MKISFLDIQSSNMHEGILVKTPPIMQLSPRICILHQTPGLDSGWLLTC